MVSGIQTYVKTYFDFGLFGHRRQGWLFQPLVCSNDVTVHFVKFTDELKLPCPMANSARADCGPMGIGVA